MELEGGGGGTVLLQGVRQNCRTGRLCSLAGMGAQWRNGAMCALSRQRGPGAGAGGTGRALPGGCSAAGALQVGVCTGVHLRAGRSREEGHAGLSAGASWAARACSSLCTKLGALLYGALSRPPGQHPSACPAARTPPAPQPGWSSRRADLYPLALLDEQRDLDHSASLQRGRLAAARLQGRARWGAAGGG